MDRIARYGKLTAKQGAGDELAGLLLKAADALVADPGCLVYLVNRQSDRPNIIWVTELWRSQADLDTALQRIRGSADVAAAMALVDKAEMVELDLLGGKFGN
jgi:quinol monooxygenase YgiN